MNLDAFHFSDLVFAAVSRGDLDNVQLTTAVLNVLDKRVLVNAVLNVSTVETLATGVGNTAPESVCLIAVIRFDLACNGIKKG